MKTTRTVDDGTEIDATVPVKMTRYIPTATQGRMAMSVSNGAWSMRESGVKGSIEVPMGSMDICVTVERTGRGSRDVMPERFTFDAKTLIEIAVAHFLGTTCPHCNGPARMIDKAPEGESGDVVQCPTCDR